MVSESWSLTARICDACKTAPSSLYCRADAAYLCLPCDSKIHAANKLASRHARVYTCEVCEQAPASFTCKADAASLCTTCDRDIHSANPLARRHERVPVVPFYHAPLSASKTENSPEAGEFFEEEAEAASWLLGDMDNESYLDLDLIVSGGEQKVIKTKDDNDVGGGGEENGYCCDGVVPVGSSQYTGHHLHHHGQVVVDGFPSYDVVGDYGSNKPYLYNFTSQSISQSVSSSSMEVGVVPDHNTMADESNTFIKDESIPIPLSGMDREARVLRYREKRKNRRFEKTIRYASRKAYAETRPRIKGRFAKRSELEVDSLIGGGDVSYGVVPSF